MAKAEGFPIEKIHVPTKKRKALQPGKVQAIAESILEIGQQEPIAVKADSSRWVLVEGLHRLEACKALGEATVLGVVVSNEETAPRQMLADNALLAAERAKMARLRQLRLEREAAAFPQQLGVGGDRTQRGRPSRSQANRVSSKAGPTTLAQWLIRQKRDGERY